MPVAAPGFLHHAVDNLRFMLVNADMGLPLCLVAVTTPLLLFSPGLRKALTGSGNAALFAAVPLSWLALVPWGALFLDAMDGHHDRPWAAWVVYAVFLGWPVVAATAIWRLRGARIAAALHVLANVPGWLLGGFVGVMAVTGDWI